MKLIQITFFYVLILFLSSCGAKQKNPPVNQNTVATADTSSLAMSKELVVASKSLAVAELKKEAAPIKKKPEKKENGKKPSSNTDVKKVKNISESEDQSGDKKMPNAKTPDKKGKAKVPGKISFLPFDKNKIPAPLKYIGKIIHGVKWEDKAGEYLLFFTETGAYDSDIDGKDAELYAYLYRNSSKTEENYSQVWKIHDYVSRCEFDLHCGFLKNTISVTDLDDDKSPEVSFAYKNGCKSEESTYNNKIYMVESGRQFKFQATNGAILDKDEEGNFLGDSWNGAPEEFRNYIQNKWTKSFR